MTKNFDRNLVIMSTPASLKTLLKKAAWSAFIKMIIQGIIVLVLVPFLFFAMVMAELQDGRKERVHLEIGPGPWFGFFIYDFLYLLYDRPRVQ
jgi:hypothetical protein